MVYQYPCNKQADLNKYLCVNDVTYLNNCVIFS